MSITTTPNLQSRLAAAKEELREAEAAVGAAVLDGGDPLAVQGRVTMAKARVEALEAALAEGRERAERRREAALDREQFVRRYLEVAWYAEFVKRLLPVLRLRQELDRAEEGVMQLGPVWTVGRQHPHHYTPPEGIRHNDRDGLRGLPADPRVEGNQDRFTRAKRAQDGGLTLDECESWAQRLAPLLDAAAAQLGGGLPALPWAPAPAEAER